MAFIVWLKWISQQTSWHYLSKQISSLKNNAFSCIYHLVFTILWKANTPLKRALLCTIESVVWYGFHHGLVCSLCGGGVCAVCGVCGSQTFACCTDVFYVSLVLVFSPFLTWKYFGQNFLFLKPPFCYFIAILFFLLFSCFRVRKNTNRLFPHYFPNFAVYFSDVYGSEFGLRTRLP